MKYFKFISFLFFTLFVLNVTNVLAFTPCDSTGICRDVPFAKPDGKNLTLDIYLPKDKTVQAIPIIVIYGGGWSAGSKADCRAVIDIELLRQNGYAAICPNYRLTSAGYTFPAQIHDVKAAVRFIRANASKYNLNVNKIGVMGGSAGGQLSSLLGVSGGSVQLEGGDLGNANYSSSVQAVVTEFGPSFFLPTNLAVTNKNFLGAYKAYLGDLPNGKNAATVNAYDASPVNYVDKNDPPFLLIHGKNDDVVPVYHSQLLDKKLKSVGVDSTLYEYSTDGVNHVANTHETLPDDYANRSIAFFDRVLKKDNIVKSLNPVIIASTSVPIKTEESFKNKIINFFSKFWKK